MIWAALLLNLASAGPIDDRCLTAPANRTLAATSVRDTFDVDTGTTYGSKGCPDTYVVDMTTTGPVYDLVISGRLTVAAVPVTQADCERLSVYVRAWSGSIVHRTWRPHLIDVDMKGYWSGSACTVPEFAYGPVPGSAVRFAVRPRALAKGLETRGQVQMRVVLREYRPPDNSEAGGADGSGAGGFIDN